MENRILGLLGISMKAGKVIFGTDACIEKIGKKKVDLIIIAEDASERTKSHLQAICEKNNISIVVYSNIEKISKSIGKVNKAVIGIREKNLANQIKQLIYRGEN